MRQYSIDKVDFGWFGLDLKKGAAAGTFVQESLVSAAHWSMKSNGVGGVARAFIPDRSGTITLSTDQESKLHQQLYALMQADDLVHNVVANGVLKDNVSGEEFVYSNMFIMGEPNESRGQEGAVYQWIFGFERKAKVLGDGDQNVIGS